MTEIAKGSVTRDRPKTQQAILDAAKTVLAESGFSAFGINAIARQAKCDKQLIYRYYGGLNGLVEAIGRDLAELFREFMTADNDASFSSYSALVEHMILALLEAFRRSDLLLRIAAWEIFDPSPVTVQLAHARGIALAHWVEARRGQLEVPKDIDVGAINATLIAAVQHMVLSAKAVGNFGGVTLAEEADWDRIRHVLSNFVRSSYVGY